MDGAYLIGGDGEAGFRNHGAEDFLLNADGILVLYFGQVRVVFGGEGLDVVIRVAAGEADVQILVGVKGYNIVRHPPDDFSEQAGRQNQRALFSDIGVQCGPDAGLHVVSGDRQLRSGLEQDPF